MLVFRASDLGNPNTFTVFPRGLASTTSYMVFSGYTSFLSLGSSKTFQVAYHDAGTKLTMTGAQLATTGLNVTLAAYSSEIIDISL